MRPAVRPKRKIGLDIEIGPVLVVDWIPAQGVWYDGVMFIFDGGVLTDEQIEQITLDATEARRFQFLTLDQASGRMRPSMVRRIACAQEALRQGAPLYAEFGRVPEHKVAESVSVDRSGASSE